MPKNIILDTDFSTDVGDAAALTMCLALHKMGAFNIVGIVVSTSLPKAPGAVDAFCTAFGVTGIKIGCWKGAAIDATVAVDWAATIYDEFSHTLGLASTVDDGLTVYQDALTAHDDVTIIALGGANSLSELLAASPSLVSSKVSELVWMCGDYPSSAAEHNIGLAAAAASDVFDNWPTQITYTGYTIGNIANCGNILVTDMGLSDIATRAFTVWNSGVSGGRRPIWDEQPVLWAAFGASCFDTVRGSNAASGATGNAFTASAAGKDQYCTLGNSDGAHQAGLINALLVYPRSGSLSAWSRGRSVVML